MRLMVLQNRMVLDLLTARSGGVCAMVDEAANPFHSVHCNRFPVLLMLYPLFQGSGSSVHQQSFGTICGSALPTANSHLWGERQYLCVECSIGLDHEVVAR